MITKFQLISKLAPTQIFKLVSLQHLQFEIQILLKTVGGKVSRYLNYGSEILNDEIKIQGYKNHEETNFNFQMLVLK